MLRKIIESRSFLEEIGGWSAISNQQSFSIKEAYKKLRGSYVKVDWRRLLCNNKATPKSKLHGLFCLTDLLHPAD